MAVLLILAVAFVLVAAIVLLPIVSGLTEVKTRPKKNKQVNKTSTEEVRGYVPPNEVVDSKGRASAIDKIHLTNDDIPVEIRLKTGLRPRKKKEKLDINLDPNNYDYDLDELIREETTAAHEEQLKEAYRGEVLGGDKEAMV